MTDEGLLKMKSHFEQTLREMRNKEIENIKLTLKSEGESLVAGIRQNFSFAASRHRDSQTQYCI